MYRMHHTLLLAALRTTTDVPRVAGASIFDPWHRDADGPALVPRC